MAESESVSAASPRLPVGRYRLRFEAAKPLQITGYAGSLWRGVLGHALKKLVCVTRAKLCADCLLYRSCVYPYVFETPPRPEAEKLKKYTAAPHPYLIDVPETPPRPARSYVLGLTLVGHGNQYLAYVVHALRSAAASGSRAFPPMDLAAVEQETVPGSSRWATILEGNNSLRPLSPAIPPLPQVPGACGIRLLTPLRLRHRENYVTPEQFEFSGLFRSLLRRVSLLSFFHTDTPLETDFAGLVARSRRVGIERPKLRWLDWTRYSGRQHTKLQMGGLVGDFLVKTADLELFWPYLWLGQWIHTGKGTVMGLGKYRIREAGAESFEGDQNAQAS